MTNRQKLIKAQKIINKYLKILEGLPSGKPTDPNITKKLGIPEKLRSYIEKAYRQGKLKGITKTRYSPENTEAKLPMMTGKDKEYLQLVTVEVDQNLKNILEKQRTAYSRKTIEALKRNLSLVDEVFGGEPIPRSWMATELRKITKDGRQDWDMVVRSELKNTQLQGMTNSILDGSSPYSNDREEIEVSVNTRYGQHRSHRWKSPAAAIKDLKKDYERKGISINDVLVFTDKLGKSKSEKEAERRITDALRFTIVQTENDFVLGYFHAVKGFEGQGYEIIRVKNTFKDDVMYKD